MQTFKHLGKKPFENIVAKGENAGDQYFFLLPQSFLLLQEELHYLSKNNCH